METYFFTEPKFWGLMFLIFTMIITGALLGILIKKNVPLIIITHIILIFWYIFLYSQVSTSDIMWSMTHIIYIAIYGCMIYLIQSNIKLKDIYTAKINLNIEIKQEKLMNYLGNRIIMLEKNNILQQLFNFMLINKDGVIQIYGRDNNNGITGYITLGESTIKRIDKIDPMKGQCIGNTSIFSENAKDFSNIDISTYNKCKESCLKTPSCNYISWSGDKGCELKTSCRKILSNNKYKYLDYRKVPKNSISIGVMPNILEIGNYIISENGKYVFTLEYPGIVKLYKNPNGKSKGLKIKGFKYEEGYTKKDLIGAIALSKGYLAFFDITKNKEVRYSTINFKDVNNNSLELILLNRGLLVMYNKNTMEILWASTNDLETLDGNKVITEIKEQYGKIVKKKYNVNKYRLENISKQVNHTGTLILYKGTETIEGSIKLYTNYINNNNYIDILNTGKYDGKYRID